MIRKLGVVLLCALVAACASAPPTLSRADRVVSYDKVELASLNETACAEELARTSHSERWWLCGYGWRPAKAEGNDKAVESYRLYWVRAAEPRLLLRIARYADGSGALWITFDDKKTIAPEAHAQVTTLKASEFGPLFARLSGSPFWAETSTYAKRSAESDETSACQGLARWILEGERDGDHRAVSAQSCGQGDWVIALGTDILRYAQTKIPSLRVDPIY